MAEQRRRDRFGPRAERSALGRLGAPMGSPGQCKAVYPLRDHPGLLFKEYRPNQLEDSDEIRLARLIGLPDRMASAADRELLLDGTCWPRTQVISAGRTVGVLIPRAPERFYEPICDAEGESELMPLLLAHLAMPNQAFPPVGLRVPPLEARLAVCTGLIAVADLFERHGLVYGDWGYKNIFWSQRDCSVYFIDTDACSYGPQPWVESFGFVDPFTPAEQPVDTYTERFRCAVMVAACLVGDKDPNQAVSGLAALRTGDGRVQQLATVLRQMATAPDRRQRLPISELQKALSTGAGAAAGTSASRTTTTTAASAGTSTAGKSQNPNIVGWDDVEPPPPRSRPVRTTPRRPQQQQPTVTVSAPAATVRTSTAPATRTTRPAAVRTAAERRIRRRLVAAVSAAVVALAVVIPLLVFVH